jgi:N-glycosylase/DNA lyase
MHAPSCQIQIPVRSYELALTLQSGQAFRWQPVGNGWEGVIGQRWVRLESAPGTIHAETAVAVADWSWLTNYLQTAVDLEVVLASFPSDEPMRASTAACHGLRLLRQDPWECLASFILSACKQIVQIQQIVATLCTRYGDLLTVPPGHAPVFSFPSPERLAGRTEQELRACKMGWRARALLETSRLVAAREIELHQLHARPVEEARQALLQLPGIGPKIANCVLLFACGFQEAFPMDVWVRRALRQLYFPRHNLPPGRLEKFTRGYFGPFAGYAQQYLFHYMRTQGNIASSRHNKRP